MTQRIHEMGVDEPLHYDDRIRDEMVEHATSDCEHGCKLYSHPATDALFLGHNTSYGCKTTMDDVLKKTLANQS